MNSLILFNLSLIVTLILTRVIAHKLHDFKNYGTKKEKSKTLTGILRKYLKKDIHHFHIGLFILIIDLILILSLGISGIKIIFLGISISLIIDQITSILNKSKNYFKKEQVTISISLHLVIIALSLFIFGN